MTGGGFPHSEIHGSGPADGSPWLIAVCRVLPRLVVPRHPSCARIRLARNFSPLVTLQFSLIPDSLFKDRPPPRPGGRALGGGERGHSLADSPQARKGASESFSHFPHNAQSGPRPRPDSELRILMRERGCGPTSTKGEAAHAQANMI